MKFLKALKSKKVLSLTLAMCLCLGVAGNCFAASGDLARSLDFSPIISAVTDVVSPTDVILVIAAVIAAGMGFVLAWFGIRKVINALRNAIMRGRLKV